MRLNKCIECHKSDEGQFGLFCSEGEALWEEDPVNGDKELIQGREANLGNVTCYDLRLAQFGKCGPNAKLFVPILPEHS